jgi:antitoxin VapB
MTTKRRAARERLAKPAARIYIWDIHGGVVVTTRTTLFQSNTTQAVRLPKDVAFPEGVSAVTVVREGKSRIITPSDAVWDNFFDEPGVDLGEREQPLAAAREPL